MLIRRLGPSMESDGFAQVKEHIHNYSVVVTT